MLEDKTILVKRAARILLFSAFLVGCANQQPPGGGDEDKIPPKVRIHSPNPNTVNFKGRSIEFRFNEYVDKRSFQDAFRISPAIKGEIEYDWSGNDVEVIFPGELQRIEPNKTFVVNLSTGLKDIHGNAITESVSFAFSTGPKIDMALVSGTVFNSDFKTPVSIFAYRINETAEYNPTKNIPDYLTESTTGAYVLTNLAPGNYRLIAVSDEDRNLLFTSERESYGALSYDVTLADSAQIKNANFYMKVISTSQASPPELDVTKYFKDSIDIVYTSIENDTKIVSPDQSIFIFFNRHKPERESFVNSFKIVGADSQPEKMVFNWRNDSLVELFAANRFKENFGYTMQFDLPIVRDSVYNFSLKFKTVGRNSFGELKGSIGTSIDTINFKDYPVKIELEAENVAPVIKYSFEVRDTVFSLTNILEAEYRLFSYIDLNSDNAYNYGYPYPFEYSEPFYIYPQSVRIRGGWTVENVVISFMR